MNNREVEIARKAFLRAYQDAYFLGQHQARYSEQAAWDDYQSELARQEDARAAHAAFDKVAYGAEHQPTELPDAIGAHTQSAVWIMTDEQQDWQREHDRLMLEEVDKRLDDCQQNWKAATEATVEKFESQVAKAIGDLILDVSHRVKDAKRELKAEIAKAARKAEHRDWKGWIWSVREFAGRLEGKA